MICCQHEAVLVLPSRKDSPLPAEERGCPLPINVRAGRFVRALTYQPRAHGGLSHPFASPPMLRPSQPAEPNATAQIYRMHR